VHSSWRISRTGASAVAAADGADGAEVVATIPLQAVPDLLDGFLDGAAGDVVVADVCDYYPRRRDGRIADIEDGMTESSWVGQRLGVSVVKASNGIYAEHLLTGGLPTGSTGRIALPVAGDHAAAKAVVMGLVDSLGFDPVSGGGLDDSWRQQPGTPVYGSDFDATVPAGPLPRLRPGENPTGPPDGLPAPVPALDVGPSRASPESALGPTSREGSAMTGAALRGRSVATHLPPSARLRRRTAFRGPGLLVTPCLHQEHAVSAPGGVGTCGDACVAVARVPVHHLSPSACASDPRLAGLGRRTWPAARTGRHALFTHVGRSTLPAASPRAHNGSSGPLWCLQLTRTEFPWHY
jgi:predicted dinucleotide-binding enzyme